MTARTMDLIRYGFAILLAAAWLAMPCIAADTPADMKAQGDRYAREGNFPQAAEAYAQALSAGAGFSDEDRLDMARVMAWGGMLDRSRRELTLLLDNNPGFVKARVQLGRVCFWMGKLDEARAEADRALKLAPQDRDALLLSGDIARLQEDNAGAIALYESILQKEEYFEARNALAYAYLAIGRLEDARKSAALLKPSLPYQRQEAEKLHAALADAQKSRVLTPEDQARQAMEQGKKLAETGQHKAAAAQYHQALARPEAFSPEEKFRMATVISWAGQLQESRRILQDLLTANPGMTAARIHLARVLLWSAEYDAALREIRRVLTAEPANREARLVYAGAQRMTRNFRKAVPLYDDLLQKQDSFDVREGLTYAHLQSGYRVETRQNLALLKPAFPYEEKSLNDLKEQSDIAFNPSVTPGFSFYSDSDDNRLWRFYATGTVWLGNWKTSLDYVHTDGRDSSTSAYNDSAVLSTYSRMPFYGGLGGGVGLADSGRDLSWYLRGDVDIPDGVIGARVGVDALSSTAVLMQNHIRALTASLSAVYRPTDRITLRGGYSYRDFSDNNNAHDLTGAASFLILRKPAAIAAGYRIRYMNFARQTGHGYFDPFNYISHVLFINLSFERGRVYGYAEPYGGYESFRRNEEGSYNFVTGGAASLGYRFNKHLAVEAEAEGGNSAVGASGAYNYYQVGARLIWTY